MTIIRKILAFFRIRPRLGSPGNPIVFQLKAEEVIRDFPVALLAEELAARAEGHCATIETSAGGLIEVHAPGCPGAALARESTPSPMILN